MSASERGANRPGELATLGREIGDKAIGYAQIAVGCVLVGWAIAVYLVSQGRLSLYSLVVVVATAAYGLLLVALGAQRVQKARFVAWTREAIERDRYVSAKEAKCARCGSWNPQEGAYCLQCGLPLKASCPQCGRRNAHGARFCIGCGRPIGSAD